MKIHCAGSEGYINQIQRIKEGFLELGCELTDIQSADLIYCNDPSAYSSEFKKINKKAKVIYNVLDLPPHCMIYQDIRSLMFLGRKILIQ